MKAKSKSVKEPARAQYDFSVLRELRKHHQLTIADVSERSGISPAVISKLERNQSLAELDTLFRLARVFGMNAADLLALAESRTAHKKEGGRHRSGSFTFDEVDYANVRMLHGVAPAGGSVARPEIHRDDFEVCWVLSGHLRITLPDERHDLRTGQALQFDAILPHAYEAVTEVEVIILHIAKPKRF
ncbi:MAG TPA: XRE family transcriptional regulator [Kiritimatiellia bacterium]|nr:XRE family transcriptional regulator [Kiritimatiellia bacterium]